MTPQERQLIDDLFDRLSKLENAPRDAEAEAAIRNGLRRAPNAAYAMVQTVLVQDEALKRANARIQELEGHGGEQQQAGGFLDSMRDAIFGQGQSSGQQQQRGSVPNVRPSGTSDRPMWNTGQAMPPGYGQGQGSGQPGPGYGQPYGGPPPVPGSGGGSFLGTAAAAAAGVVGGSLLLSSIRGMMGGGHHQSFGDGSGLGGSGSGGNPWSDQSNSTLAHDAGVDDIGSSGRGGNSDYGSRQGAFEQVSNDDYDDGDGDEFDAGDDGDGGSDYA